MEALKNFIFLVLAGFIFLFPQESFANCLNVTPSFSSSRTSICGVGPHVINFTNTSTGVNSNTAGYQWYLNGNQFANTTGIGNSVSDTITIIGIYNYTLVAYDTANFCTDTAFFSVTITERPLSAFSFPVGPLCPNSPISFTNNSTNTVPGTRYLWRFGDGTTDTSQNPTHSYGRGGNFTVSFRVFNSDSCSAGSNQMISILNTPNINISGDDGDGNTFRCLNAIDTVSQETVTFFNNSAPGITYTWDFGDGSPTVTQTSATSPDTVIHKFTSYGTFPVVCSAIDSNGCLYTDTVFVVFDKFISASFSVPLANISGCAPHVVTPINVSINATRYEWDFGDGSPIINTTDLSSPSYTYDSTGTYYIRLRAINDCGFSVSTVGPITVARSPEIDFNTSLFTRGCSPQSVFVVDNSQLIFPANNFSWDMGNGNIYNGVTPPAQIYGQGTHTIKFIGSNGCGSDSLTEIINVDTLPYAIVSLSPTEGCSGMEVNGSALNFSYGTLSRWFVDGNQVAFGDTLPTQTFVNNSTAIQNHVIRYSITNHCGTYDSVFTIIVHPAVEALLNATPTIVCSGDTVFHFSISNGDSLSYEWKSEDGTILSTNASYDAIYNRKGVDSLLLKITGYCGEDSIIKVITIDSVPYANVAISPDEGCSPLIVSGNSVPYGNNTNSRWFRNGGFYFAGANMPQTTYTNNGNSVSINTIRYNISNTCGAFDTSVTINVHPQVRARMTPINGTVCIGDSLQFRNISNGDSLKVIWKFGNGDTTSDFGPHYRTFNSPGQDTTWLFVEGFCGSDTVFSITTVNQYPVARIMADVDSGCEDLSVNLSNGAPTGSSYLWNINGGFPFLSFSPTPSILFTTPGSNRVVLTVDSLGCSTKDTTQIVVFPGPDPSFSYTPITGCSDLEVAITNTSPASFGDEYLWSFGNGNIDTIYSPSNQTFVNVFNIMDSVYPIQLVIYTANGCNDSITQNVTVRPLPLSSFSISDSIVCEKEILVFQNNSIGGNTYKWFFGNGDSSLINSPSYSYDTAGTYLVTLISTSIWNCMDTSFQTVVINPNPIAQFIADSVCFSYRTNFTDYSLFGPVTWQWSFGDGDSSIIQNPSHLYQTDSIFKVSLFVSNAFGCNDSVINSVIIYDRPVANFGNSVACAKKQTNFYDSSSANPVLWNWDFGDGTIDSSQNPQHIYAVGGNYPVTLIVENASGCIDTITKIVTISTVPQTYFITDSVCFGSPTLFIDSTILNYAPSSYFWNFGDGNFSGLQNPVYQYTSPGTYFASLTVTNINGCDSTFSDSVVVNSTPVSNFIHDTVCYGFATSFIRINSANNPVFYIWNYGDGSPLDTNLAPVVSHNYLSDGAYLVTLTVINNGGCADSSSQTVIVHPTPIARFTPQFDTICLGDSITFLNSSSFATDYFWNFGDGNLDSLAIPVHVYNSAGLFVTTLITENIFGCLDTAFDTLVVLQNPVTNFNLDTVCFANPTTFTNLSSGNNLNWRWNFGDGNTSTLQNPTHIFGFDSTFNVILTATSPFGCATSHSEIAQVLPIVDAQFNSSLACVGRAINFTDSSSGIPNSWRWNFGDGNTSTLQNPIHTYATTGNFTVTLIVINTAGCSDTISRVLFVNSIPVPDFVADTICVGNSMTFVNLTTNTQPVASSFWDFGDGNSSTANNPTYVYAASGIYTVTLTVTNNGGCASSISKLVIVNPNPVADFTHDTVCVGLATTFTDASSGIPIAWQWNFGDFSPIDSTSGSSVSHSYATAGLYTATLNIQSGANGCGNQVIKYITVLDAVDADFTVASPICEGTAVQFVNNSTSTGAGIITTNWNFGDGNKSSVNNPIHNYTGAGVYTVVLSIASSQGCIDSDSTNVLVNPVPVADFDFTKNICIGLPTNFYDSSTVSVGAINSWNWSFGDGNIDSIQNPFNIYNASGTYLVNLQVTTDSGCSDMNSQNVIINPAAVANFTYNSVCVGDTIIFKDQSTVQIPDSIVSWYWEFGDGTSSSVQNPSHQYAGNTQNYLVKLTVTTSFGCLKDTTILVSYLPVPVFNYGPEFFGYCEDEPVTFYDSSVIAAPSTIVAWEWTFRDGNQSFIQNPTHIYDSSGNYFIKLKTTSSDGCVFYDSLAAPLIIYPKPIANFLTVPSVVSVFLPEVYFDNKTTGAVSYIWDFGDGSTGTEFAPRHLFPGIVGFYTTTQYAFSAFGCMDSISNIIYVKEEYTLYAPNSFTPSKDFNKTFLVKGHGITDFNMKIFDRWGELLFETMDLNQGWDGKHKGKDCAVGVYVFLITTRDSEGNDHSKTGHVTLIK